MIYKPYIFHPTYVIGDIYSPQRSRTLPSNKNPFSILEKQAFKKNSATSQSFLEIEN